MGRLKFVNGIVQDFTYILSTRDYRHIGQIVGFNDAHVKINENSADEMSMSVSKIEVVPIHGYDTIAPSYIQSLRKYIWEQISDFKLVYIKELDEYFEIKVSIDDSTSTVKAITGTSLCESELSQLLISMEINTESDLKAHEVNNEYIPTIFYNENDSSTSLLHRALKDKAPHYSIGHVDNSLKNLQRIFSVSNTSIYDFFTGECSEQFNCIFKFDSTKREISVYDLSTFCLNEDCGYRGDFYDTCPKCGSKNLRVYGKDTTIYVDKNNLTEQIQLECNTDEVKNCFKLEAGDDIVTAAIRDINPNGSDYIYYRTEYQEQDMPETLVQRWKEYDSLYTDVLNNKLKDTEIFNQLSENEQNLILNETLNINTYQDITDKLDEANEKRYYYEHSMMPTVDLGGINATEEASKLKSNPSSDGKVPIGMSPMSVSTLNASTSIYTINSSVISYAKLFVKTGYVRLEVDESEGYKPRLTIWSNEDETIWSALWEGRIKVTNYSDKDDVAYSEMLSIEINTNHLDFIQQKILKMFGEDENEEGSVFDVLAIDDINEFKIALTYYSKVRLTSYKEAIESAIGILLNEKASEIGQAVFDEMYPSYREKLEACDAELSIRESQIKEQQEKYEQLFSLRTSIHNLLNFENFLGEDLYKIFCAYRREDVYSNSNYISTNLDTVEINKKAKDFLNLAQQELYKSAEQQITVSASLYNLLLIKEFEPIVDYFECGNWIHVRIDGTLYKLRLVSYTINFGNTQTLDVEFANATKSSSIVDEAKKIISSAKSMATSFNHVSKQAAQGSNANDNITDWNTNGLNASLVQIQSNKKQDIIINKNGLLGRMYDEDTKSFDPKQLRIIGNILAFTNDNWKTISLAVGEHSYTTYNEATNEMITRNGYGVTAEFLSSEFISGKTIIGGKIFSENYSDGNGRDEKGTYIDLLTGGFSLAGGKLKYDPSSNSLSISSDGLEENIIETLVNINITADNLHIKSSNIDGQLNYNQLKNVDSSTIISKINNQYENGIDTKCLIGEKISVDLIPDISANKITSGKLQLKFIEDVNFTNIKGTATSDQITNTLSNKAFNNCTWSGDFLIGKKSATYTEITSDGALNTSCIQAADIVVPDGSQYVHGVTGEYIFGDKKVKFINGIAVEIADDIVVG